MDEENNGAAFTRNQLIEQATGDYVAFLDADDLLDATFVASCLAVIEPMSYVYTDHYDGDSVIKCQYEHIAPFRIEHYITTLMPIAMARLMFDTTLPCMEDVDFYLKARRAGYKPIYLPRPLWHYRQQYGMSGTNRRDARQAALMIKQGEGILRERYG